MHHVVCAEQDTCARARPIRPSCRGVKRKLVHFSVLVPSASYLRALPASKALLRDMHSVQARSTVLNNSFHPVLSLLKEVPRSFFKNTALLAKARSKVQGSPRSPSAHLPKTNQGEKHNQGPLTSSRPPKLSLQDNGPLRKKRTPELVNVKIHKEGKEMGALCPPVVGQHYKAEDSTVFHRRKRAVAEFDIDNVLLPASLAPCRAETLCVKEILTPLWRSSSTGSSPKIDSFSCFNFGPRAVADILLQCPVLLGELRGQGPSVTDGTEIDDDTSDAHYARLHLPCEVFERKRYLGLLDNGGCAGRSMMLKVVENSLADLTGPIDLNVSAPGEAVSLEVSPVTSEFFTNDSVGIVLQPKRKEAHHKLTVPLEPGVGSGAKPCFSPTGLGRSVWTPRVFPLRGTDLEALRAPLNGNPPVYTIIHGVDSICHQSLTNTDAVEDGEGEIPKHIKLVLKLKIDSV